MIRDARLAFDLKVIRKNMMAAPKYQADLPRVIDLLERWIGEGSGPDGLAWLREKRQLIAGGAPDWQFFTSFSGAPRFVGKHDLELSEHDRSEAESVRPGWHPHEWSIDQAARAALVLSYPTKDRAGYVSAIEQLFSTADVRESVALYRCLPLLPFPDEFRGRAAEGVRSNITSVFNAVAHHNPYPAEYFDEGAWNQMILKALFVGSPLFPVVGLEKRANPTLARMLVDYARERWAAHRSVSPELWRLVGPFAENHLQELAIALESHDEAEREAAALALAASDSSPAQDLLSRWPDFVARIRGGDLTWERFADKIVST